MPMLVVRTIALALMAMVLLASPASAQSAGAVSCGNGYYCPAGNSCLQGGLCGPNVNASPGSTRTSTGGWCDPGFREHRYRPGACLPNSYSDCTNGLICPPGTQCSADGSECTGGPAATGPMCGANQCAAGRICSSTGSCMNPDYFQDCGNGTICSKSKACGYPDGCAIVGPQRTRQQPVNR